MGSLPKARWWSVRRAQNRKPATYTCPLCGGFLPALSEHMLLAPEGDSSRRRHAHTACVMRARRAGRLRTLDEYKRTTRDEQRASASRSSSPGASGSPTGLVARVRGLLKRLPSR